MLHYLSYKALLSLAARLFYTRPQLCAEAKQSPTGSCDDSTESRRPPRPTTRCVLFGHGRLLSGRPPKSPKALGRAGRLAWRPKEYAARAAWLRFRVCVLKPRLGSALSTPPRATGCWT